MTPNLHLAKSGCRVCSIKSRSAKQKNINNPQRQQRLQKEFIEKARKIHLKKYDYSKVKYVNAHTKVTIICPIHNEFTQTPKHHANDGYGCNLCGYEIGSKKQALTKKDFIKQAKKLHGNKYDYSEVEYVNFNTKVKVICPLHETFEVTPCNHLKKDAPRGCKKCGRISTSDKQRFSSEDFIKKSKSIHGNIYDYSKSKYKGIFDKVTIICNKHREFEQVAKVHLMGSGCPKCALKGEGRIYEYLLKKNIVVKEYSIKNKRYDFYLPEHKLIIERDGEQHYKEHRLFKKVPFEENIKNDKFKTKLVKEVGLKIARIPYWLTQEEEEIEIENILDGKPTYPDIPDLKQAKTRPKPKKNF
jgi:very-short-patch-repair endonuclease